MFEERTPTLGYILKNWETTGYRSTAIAYMKREGLKFVEHKNGKFYSLAELEDSSISGENRLKTK